MKLTTDQAALALRLLNSPRRRVVARLRQRRVDRAVRLRQFLCLVMAFSLVMTSTPASAQTVVKVSREWQMGLAFWLRSNEIPLRIARTIAGPSNSPRRQEKQKDRDAKVARIQIYPGDVTIRVEERITFAAVAYDTDGNAIGGVGTKWSARDDGRNHAVRISPTGEFEAVAPGTYKVTAEGAGKKAHVKIIVVDGPRRKKDEPPMGTFPVSSRDLPPGASSAKAKKQNQRRSAHAVERGPRSARPMAIPAMPLLPPEDWNGDNYWSADDPGNSVGDPPGHPLDGGAGSGNFQLSAPVLNLPGRGLNLSLALTYNSRVWNKAGNSINFDIDRDWPAPGWSLGFGKVVDLGSGGSMIIEADGTRHAFAGSIQPFSYGQMFTGHTADGTFIDYKTWKNSSGVMTWAEVNLPNGTQIHYYCQGPGGVFPTQIIDANGNFITITYVNNTGPRIQTITDTLNRSINFHYDASNLLTAVTTPGLGGGTRTLVRIGYRQLSITPSNYSFSGLNALVRDQYPYGINSIFYPGTNTGYWFGEGDSYSTYGMIAKVSQRRGMSFSAGSLNEQGTITSSGQNTQEQTYSYPLSPSAPGGSSLTDAPTYTTLTETWTRDGFQTDQAITTYDVHQEANPRTISITLPNGTRSTQISHNAPGSFLDGLVFQDQTIDAGDTVLRSSNVTWQAGAYDTARPIRTEATNHEINKKTATVFDYGTSYNQVIGSYDYDYSDPAVTPTVLLRATRTQYLNNSNYTTRHIFNLPVLVEVFAGDNITRVSRTDYQYDGQVLTDAPGVVQHAYNHNPYAPQYEVCDCNQWDHWQIECLQWNCYWTSEYLSITDYRGNVTQVTTYADAVNATGPVVDTRRYDITGNMVTATSSCCAQTSVGYTIDTQYAYPQSQTRGSATDGYAQLTTTATYDFNSAAILSATDANGRTSQTSYLPESLRPQSSTRSTGAHTDYSYDDASLSVTTTTYLAAPPVGTGALTDQNVKTLNGRAQVRQEKALAADGQWDIVDTIYDSMGRVFQQSRPYHTGQTAHMSTTTYDSLNRAIRISSPDGSTTETYYNERDFDPNDSYAPVRPNVVDANAAGETTLVKDAWGRERWGRVDAQGRLMEVVEANPAGGGSVATSGYVTSYSYDTLGKLTGVTQGVQTRSFKYDSLGRLVAQKLAETSATLNEAGQYVGSGTWSDVFTYDIRSNVTSRTDARGVKTNYNYNDDPLNRLQTVTWDTSGDPYHSVPSTDPNYYTLRVLEAATVTYQYRTKTNPNDLKDVTQLSSVSSAGVSAESYGYDSEGRVFAKTLTLSSRPSNSMTTDYTHDSLDRVTDLYYPPKDLVAQSQSSRKHIHHDFDVASRLSSLAVNSQTFASQIYYNASSQTTSLIVDAGGAHPSSETYDYNAQTGLLDGQTVVRAGSTLMNLSYDYVGANGKRVGQLRKILNNLNHNKDRGYTYDALGRLSQATGGPAGTPLWTQSYTYDRFGNRTSVSATGNSARLNPSERSNDDQQLALAKPAEPQVLRPTDQIMDRSEVQLPDSMRDAKSSESNSTFHHPSRRATKPLPPPVPPVFTDNPLSGGSIIKAVHITELRTAVNDARARGGLGPATWTDTSLPGVQVKATHIVELRTRLAEARSALGLSAATYTDPSLGAGGSIKAVHIVELRDRVTEALLDTGSCPPSQTLRMDQYVKNFYQGSLNRQPNAVELQSWTDQLRQAYYQSPSQLLSTANYMGRQIFKSTEYANRGRTDYWYVYDLYKAYLQREPDQGGWDFWTSQVGPNGRDAVRLGFEGSQESANKIASLCPGTLPGSISIPLDGIANLAYDETSNRISTSGFAYDKGGNQVRIVRPDGSAQKYQYDAANRLIFVRDDFNYTLATYTYGHDNQRLVSEDVGMRTYYAADRGAVLNEYTEVGGATTPSWSKSCIYIGARLLSALTPNGSGGERIQYHHPDRLGTRVVTGFETNGNATSFEQVTLPYGTALNAESTGATNRRFTSYDRSVMTGLDYAVNRHYDAQQGRFTQVDPIGMRASTIEHPQTLNLYSYVANDPVNKLDPNGLFWGAIGRFFKKLLRIIALVALAVALIVVSYFIPVLLPAFIPGWLGSTLAWTAFIAGFVVAAVPISEFFGHINQWLNRCRVPNFEGLSRGRQQELSDRGVTPEQWNALKNKQRLGYFNITAAIGALGLSLAGWIVDWAAGGIQQDRVFFVAGPGATNLVGDVIRSGRFTFSRNPPSEHGPYTEGYRQGFSPSLQLSFTPSGTRLEADLDSFNLSAGFFGFIGHGVEYLLHNIGRKLGGSGKTNPYNVAFRSSWECK